jgi:hypothetical protein
VRWLGILLAALGNVEGRSSFSEEKEAKRLLLFRQRQYCGRLPVNFAACMVEVEQE